MFTEGQAEFMEEEEVDEGVGPRFNFVELRADATPSRRSGARARR